MKIEVTGREDVSRGEILEFDSLDLTANYISEKTGFSALDIADELGRTGSFDTDELTFRVLWVLR